MPNLIDFRLSFFTPLEIMPRLRGRSHFGAAKARCSLRARLRPGRAHAPEGGPLGRRLQRGLDFRIIPARFNPLRQRLRGECSARFRAVRQCSRP
jgi:hypothetical protein